MSNNSLQVTISDGDRNNAQRELDQDRRNLFNQIAQGTADQIVSHNCRVKFIITQPMLTSTEQNSSQKNAQHYQSGDPSGRGANQGYRTLDSTWDYGRVHNY